MRSGVAVLNVSWIYQGLFAYCALPATKMICLAPRQRASSTQLYRRKVIDEEILPEMFKCRYGTTGTIDFIVVGELV
jgi:hypothetical protein